MKAIVWSKNNCPWCDRVKALLVSKGFEVEERNVNAGYTVKDLWAVLPGAKSVPQVFIEGNHIGGFQETQEYITLNHGAPSNS